MLSTNNRRVGVFIDVQNMYYSARNLYNRKVNFGNIVKEAVGEAQLIRAMGYTISTKGGDEEPFFEALRKAGIDVVSKDLLEYDSGNKKGDWDVGITIDIVRMIDMLDVIVLVSGDGDFVPLAKYIKSRGRMFHVISFRESTSTALVDETDLYTNLSDDKRKFLISDRRGTTTSTTTRSTTSRSSSKTTATTRRPGRPRTKKTPEVEYEQLPPSFIPSSYDDLDEDDIDQARTRRLTF